MGATLPENLSGYHRKLNIQVTCILAMIRKCEDDVVAQKEKKYTRIIPNIINVFTQTQRWTRYDKCNSFTFYAI